MKEINGIFQVVQYGKIIVKVGAIMDSKGISVNTLSTKAGIKHNVAKRYYEGTEVSRIDLDVLSRIMFVLDVENMEDVLEYIKPHNNEK